MAVSQPIGMEGSQAADMRSSYAFVIGGGDSVVEIHRRESGLSYCLVRSSNRTDLSLVSVRGESVCWLHRKQRFPRPQFDVGISQEPLGSIRASTSFGADTRWRSANTELGFSRCLCFGGLLRGFAYSGDSKNPSAAREPVGTVVRLRFSLPRRTWGARDDLPSPVGEHMTTPWSSVVPTRRDRAVAAVR